MGRAPKRSTGSPWTAAVFKAAMLRTVKPAIEKVVSAHSELFPNGLADVKIAMDRAPYHTAALKRGLLRSMELAEEQLVPHPSHSPDFQAPVEWAQGWLKKAVRKYLQAHPRVSCDQAIRKAIQQIFLGKERVDGEQVVTADRVMGAFKQMESNYSAVVKAGGGYGAKHST